MKGMKLCFLLAFSFRNLATLSSSSANAALRSPRVILLVDKRLCRSSIDFPLQSIGAWSLSTPSVSTSIASSSGTSTPCDIKAALIKSKSVEIFEIWLRA